MKKILTVTILGVFLIGVYIGNVSQPLPAYTTPKAESTPKWVTPFHKVFVGPDGVVRDYGRNGDTQLLSVLSVKRETSWGLKDLSQMSRFIIDVNGDNVDDYAILYYPPVLDPKAPNNAVFEIIDGLNGKTIFSGEEEQKNYYIHRSRLYESFYSPSCEGMAFVEYHYQVGIFIPSPPVCHSK